MLSSKLESTLLGIDAATPPASIAVVRGGCAMASRVGPFGRDTDAWILQAIDDVLAEAGVRVEHLDGIGVTVGPGTFTGIRVGMATAMGLGRGAGLALAGVSTLEAIALAAAAPPAPILATIDARRGQVYAAIYESTADSLRCVRQPWIGTPGRIAGVAAGFAGLLAAGTGLGARELAALPAAPGSPHPLAVAVARIAAIRIADGPPSPPRPFYLRELDARPPASRRRAL